MGVTRTPPHIARLEVEHSGASQDAIAVEPRSPADVATILKYASERDLVVQVVGGGTHSGYGNPPDPDLLLMMSGLAEVEVWDPEDLTVVVDAGASIAEVEAKLAGANQTSVMPEHPGSATYGGVISAGISALRRGKLYSTRERVLEATLVTGDGRIVRSGGRVVKNVTGYDLHRLAVGAFGTMGVLVSVCLKLWPRPHGEMTVRLDDPDRAAAVTRPLALLETSEGVSVYLSGTESEVEAQANRLGGSATPGHVWPEDPNGEFTWSLRLPPALAAEGLAKLPSEWDFLVVHGVGEIRCASDHFDPDLRDWAESVGGALVMTSGEAGGFDPWGSPPPGMDLQKRLIAQFDPKRVINPGRLPGGL